MKLRDYLVLCALTATAVATNPAEALAGASCNCESTQPAGALEGTVADAAFYSIQLLNQGGANYVIHVYDQTYDAAAYGTIVVTDCATGNVLVNQSFDSSYGNFNTPGSIDVPVVITAQQFQVTLTAQEYSASSLFFGNDQVYLGNPPTSQLNTQTRCYESFCDCPVYASAALLGGTVQNAAFYSLQLLNQGGGNYLIHVYDQTFDAAAYGTIVVTDCATGAVLINQSFDSSYGNFNTPGTLDVPVVIPAANFTVTLTTMEFSASSLYFGNEQVYLGNPPTSQVNTQTRCYFAADPPTAVESVTWGQLKSRF
jgi:hypothetical protein